VDRGALTQTLVFRGLYAAWVTSCLRIRMPTAPLLCRHRDKEGFTACASDGSRNRFGGVASTCGWSSGCIQDVLGNDRFCTYHSKIAAGLVTTTRGEGRAILPISSPEADQGVHLRSTRRWATQDLDISALNGTEGGVRVRGELDLETVDRLWAVLVRLDGSGPVVIEASDITFMDSTGLNLLLNWASHARNGGPGVIIRNPSRAVRRVLEIALPAGMPGVEVDFFGAGPGAAHRLTQLLRSTIELRVAVASEWAHAARICEVARRARAEHAAVHRLLQSG